MKIKTLVVVILSALFIFSNSALARGHGGYHRGAASTYHQSNVKGYYRSNGTYVRGHYRSRRDNNPYNNWSTRGNINPHTGDEGTHYPHRSRYYHK